jgi:hypothetical protein
MEQPTATRRRPRRPALVVIGALALVVAAAWGLQAATSHGAGETSVSPAPYAVAVKRGGKVLKEYDLAALHALPQHTVMIDGKEQNGPLLATVLADAGAQTYVAVLVRGAGLRDGGSLRVTKAQVLAGVQLDFSDRGTVKVCGPKLPWSTWVRDVITVSVD